MEENSFVGSLKDSKTVDYGEYELLQRCYNSGKFTDLNVKCNMNVTKLTRGGAMRNAQFSMPNA